ncbi:MAG: manganese efflux pump MntP family protein [Dysgonomonas sp.]|nr:manganese efflux pump MntP family protein [Dysgonomonas sp.]
MDLIQISVLGIGLSMDSLIVALTSGAILRNYKPINILKIAGMLAFIQMSMTIFGWLVGSTFVRYINEFDHWIAFGILFFLGGKVIWESLFGEEESKPFNPLDIRIMFGLALATSIDATAVGLSLSMVGIYILMPAILIGLITFIMSSVGIVFGSKAGQKYNLGINIAGGAMLILIGCSILLEHTVFSCTFV